MPTTYKNTPGVYIQEISKFPPSVAQVQTAIPAFIGYTQKAVIRGIDQYNNGLKDITPIVVRVTSLLEYKNFFGEAENEKSIKVDIAEGGDISVKIEKYSPHNMYYSLQAFFANGGGPCYIVSVGKTSEEIKVDALKGGLTAIEKEDEVTLIVCPESLILGFADYSAFYDAALAQCEKLQDRFVVMDAKLDVEGKKVHEAANDFRSNCIGTENLKYGAAYGPQIKTIFNYKYEDKDVEVNVSKIKGKDGKLLTGVGVPQDGKIKLDKIDPKENSLYGQYFPLVKSAIAANPVILPAAPLVVGVYASVDNSRGVWKAPANVSLSAVVEPTIKITPEEQDNLNLDTTGKSINAIRSFTGKGTLIWGARTLAGNDNEWRYVSVRRFFIMVEESIKKATEGFVFEPNDSNTWTKVRSMIENFLLLQWRAGALQGAKPEQSFFVHVGLNETMTALDILEGRMIIEIGIAVVRPAEFIILTFSHKMADS